VIAFLGDAKSYGGTTPVAVIEVTYISLSSLPARTEGLQAEESGQTPYVDFPTAAHFGWAHVSKGRAQRHHRAGLYLGVKPRQRLRMAPFVSRTAPTPSSR